MSHPYTTDLNIRLIIIMVFFVALAFGSKRGWMSVKELVATGSALVVAAVFMLYDVALKAAVGIYGHNAKAFEVAAATVVPFAVALALAIWIMVRRLKANPPAAKPAVKARPSRPPTKKPAKPSDAPPQNAVKPKLQRSKGRKRRF